METDPVIIEPPIPLVYNDSIDTTNMTNILLIYSSVGDKQVFYESANLNTFPIIYDSNSKTDSDTESDSDTDSDNESTFTTTSENEHIDLDAETSDK